MKVNAVKSGLLAVALVALASGSAWANTITPKLVGFTPGSDITYEAELTSGEIHPGDGFTIYDIGGFTGFIAIDPLWTAVANNLPSPWTDGSPLTTPDSVDLNVHFTYMGPADEVQFGETLYSPFKLATTSMFLVTDDWESQDHLLGTAGVIDGGVADSHQNTISVPAHVPDGGSTAMLLGSVLFAFGALRRKFNG
jgi:hypothetical protein